MLEGKVWQDLICQNEERREERFSGKVAFMNALHSVNKIFISASENVNNDYMNETYVHFFLLVNRAIGDQ